MTLLQKINNLTWWNEIAKLKDILKTFLSSITSLDSRVDILENIPSPTGDFIPLTGTTVSNPITGNIEILGEANDLKIFSKNIDNQGYEGAIIFGDGKMSIINTFSENPSLDVSISLGTSGVSANRNFSSDITDLYFTQKVYVDERGSVVNTTTAVLSESDLNTQYPNAKDGFSVICRNVVGGGKFYIKAGVVWVYQQILVVT